MRTSKKECATTASLSAPASAALPLLPAAEEWKPAIYAEASAITHAAIGAAGCSLLYATLQPGQQLLLNTDADCEHWLYTPASAVAHPAHARLGGSACIYKVTGGWCLAANGPLALPLSVPPGQPPTPLLLLVQPHSGHQIGSTPAVAVFAEAFAAESEAFMQYLAAPQPETLELTTRMLHLLCLAQRTQARASEVDTQLQMDPMHQLRTWLDKHCHMEVTIPEMARMTGMNTTYLKQRFKAAWGTTIHAYIMAQRMKRVEHLLQYTALPLEAVAEQCGYKSPAALIRIFKRHAGETPAEWRKKNSEKMMRPS